MHPLSLAWSVSLHPTSETYASTGGSGAVQIRSAKAENFGERLTTLSPGRIKFGMQCAHVRTTIPFLQLTRYSYEPKSPDGKRIALASESGQVFIFDLESNALATAFTSHAMSVRSVAWSYDSSVRIPVHINSRTFTYLYYKRSSCSSVHQKTNGLFYMTSEAQQEMS